MQAKTIKINSKVFPFTTAEEASKLYMKLRAKGRCSHRTFARFYDEAGQEVGYVAPNGNVFDHPVADWQNPAKPIFQYSFSWSAKV